MKNLLNFFLFVFAFSFFNLNALSATDFNLEFPTECQFTGATELIILVDGENSECPSCRTINVTINLTDLDYSIMHNLPLVITATNGKERIMQSVIVDSQTLNISVTVTETGKYTVLAANRIITLEKSCIVNP